MAKRLIQALLSVPLLSGAALLVAVQSAEAAGWFLNACDKSTCPKLGGTFVCLQFEIPGDGVVYTASTPSPKDKPEFLCGLASAKRHGVDTDWISSCLLNTPQPPTAENLRLRQCFEPCNDMAVEGCWVSAGSDASLNCSYANAKEATPKDVELCGCWK